MWLQYLSKFVHITIVDFLLFFLSFIELSCLLNTMSGMCAPFLQSQIAGSGNRIEISYGKPKASALSQAQNMFTYSYIK